jgi:large subunit ribosomal protein LP0
MSKLFEEDYPNVLMVNADNVRAEQLKTIRKNLDKCSVLMMGKNTLIRKAIQDHEENDSKRDCLLDHLSGNVGLVFTKESIEDVTSVIHKHKLYSQAKQGKIAPSDVVIRAGVTALGPEKIRIFQAHKIPTFISKGSIAIKEDITLVRAGEKIYSEQSNLIKMLGISPFQCNLKIKKRFENGTLVDDDTDLQEPVIEPSTSSPVDPSLASEIESEDEMEEDLGLGFSIFD